MQATEPYLNITLGLDRIECSPSRWPSRRASKSRLRSCSSQLNIVGKRSILCLATGLKTAVHGFNASLSDRLTRGTIEKACAMKRKRPDQVRVMMDAHRRSLI